MTSIESTQPSTEGKTADDFLELSKADLRRELEAGHAIDPTRLDDSEYQGVSLGLPRFLEDLTWKKFMKTFHRDPETGALRGWNVRLEQNALDEPCVPMTKRGAPITFGHYRVVDAAGVAMPVRAQHGLLIDYRQDPNGRMDPIRRVRDPLVAINPGSVDLLLGWSYVDLGFGQVGTPSYFTLERVGPLSRVV